MGKKGSITCFSLYVIWSKIVSGVIFILFSAPSILELYAYANSGSVELFSVTIVGHVKHSVREIMVPV